jgi:hypothetical protein
MSHTRLARGTTGKGQHHRRRPQDPVDFISHIGKGNPWRELHRRHLSGLVKALVCTPWVT